MFNLLIFSGLAGLALVPVELLERLPSVCLNRHLFGFCPGCGTVRALAHLLRGDLVGALKCNVNCLVIAPLIAGLAAWQFWAAVRDWIRVRSGRHSRFDTDPA